LQGEEVEEIAGDEEAGVEASGVKEWTDGTIEAREKFFLDDARGGELCGEHAFAPFELDTINIGEGEGVCCTDGFAEEFSVSLNAGFGAASVKINKCYYGSADREGYADGRVDPHLRHALAGDERGRACKHCRFAK